MRAKVMRMTGFMRGSMLAGGLLCILALIGSAEAQVVSRPIPLDTSLVAKALADAGVPVARKAQLGAFWEYLNDFEAAMQRVDAELQSLHQRTHSEPGAMRGERDTVALNGILRRLIAEQDSVVARLISRLQATTDPTHEAGLEQARMLLSLHALLRTRVLMRNPPDLSVMLGAPGSLANIQGRLRAYQALAASQDALRLELARQVQEMGAVGLDRTQLSVLPAQLKDPDAVIYTPEWAAVLREELVALRAVESELPAADRARVADEWLPWMVGKECMPLILDRHHLELAEPRGLMRTLLRLKGSTPEQREQLRAIGRRMMAMRREELRAAAEEFAQTGVPVLPASKREQMMALFPSLWNAAGLEHAESSMEDPNESPRSGGTLEPADEAEFGDPYETPEIIHVEGVHSEVDVYAPPPPDVRLAETLNSWLGVPPDKHAVVEAIVHDARECWLQQVVFPQPEPAAEISGFAPDSDQALLDLRAYAVRQLSAATLAWKSADDCRTVMFDHVLLAFEGAVNPKWMPLLNSSAFLRGLTGPMGGRVYWADVDWIQTVFEYPFSTVTRRAVIDALADSSAEFQAFATLHLTGMLSSRTLRECQPTLQLGSERIRASFQKQWSEALELDARVTQGQQRMHDIVDDAVQKCATPAELVQWTYRSKQAECPALYPDLAGVTKLIETGAAAQPEQLAALQKLLSEARDAMVRSGDIARRIALSQHDMVNNSAAVGSAKQEWNARMECFRVINQYRLEVLEARVRSALADG